MIIIERELAMGKTEYQRKAETEKTKQPDAIWYGGDKNAQEGQTSDVL